METLSHPERRKEYDLSLAQRWARPKRYDASLDSPGSPKPAPAAREAAKLPVTLIAEVAVDAWSGTPVVLRHVSAPSSSLGLNAAAWNELADAAIPIYRNSFPDGSGHAFFRLCGGELLGLNLHGVSCLLPAGADGRGAPRAVCALSTLPVYALLETRLTAHCATLLSEEWQAPPPEAAAAPPPRGHGDSPELMMPSPVNGGGGGGASASTSATNDSTELLFAPSRETQLSAVLTSLSASTTWSDPSAILTMGDTLDPRYLAATGATELLRCIKLILLEARLLLIPARDGPTAPAPSLGSATTLAIASLLPHGLLPTLDVEQGASSTTSTTGAAGAFPAPPSDALCVFSVDNLLLPSVSCWHARLLRPNGMVGRVSASGGGWLAAAVDEPSGIALTPLAHATLTLYPGAESDGSAPIGSVQLSIPDRSMAQACSLTLTEQALAAKLSSACKAALLEAADGTGTALWEGSGDWVRSQLHAYVTSLLSMTSKQMIAGDAGPLQVAYGAHWLRSWCTATSNFPKWVKANSLHGPGRLWKTRLAAEERPPSRGATEDPNAANAGNLKETVRNVTGKVTNWFKQKAAAVNAPAPAPPTNTTPSVAANNLLFGVPSRMRESPPLIDSGSSPSRSSEGGSMSSPPVQTSTTGVFGGWGRASGKSDDSPQSVAGENEGEYYGEMINGRRHGRGVLFRTLDDSVYLGEWHHGKEHGHGAELIGRDEGAAVVVEEGGGSAGSEAVVASLAKMDSLSEEVEEEAGDSKDDDEDSFVDGEAGPVSDDSFVDDSEDFSLHANGINGAQLYIGTFADGARHGFGRLVAPSSGVRYAGQWANGTFHGEGRWSRSKPGSCFLALEQYEGSWQGGKRHGFGTHRTLTNGESYEGEWCEGRREGVGRLQRAQAAVFGAASLSRANRTGKGRSLMRRHLLRRLSNRPPLPPPLLLRVPPAVG